MSAETKSVGALPSHLNETWKVGGIPASLLRAAGVRQVPLVGGIRWHIELINGMERKDVMRKRGIVCEGHGERGCSHQEQ